MKDEKIIAYIVGELEEGEKDRVEQWIAQSDDNTRYYHDLRNAWVDALLSGEKNSLFDVTKGWNEFVSRIKAQQRRKTIKRRLIRVTSAAAAAIVLFFGVYHFLKPTAEIKKFEAAAIADLNLPDGSQVTLNKGATIKYPEKFLGNEREITIFGEGFFEVKTDKHRPFIVKAGQYRVEVVGTEFNVKKQADQVYEVYVKSGSVLVYKAGARNNAKKLLPGDFATLKPDGEKELKAVGRNYLSWKNQHLVFVNTPMNKVIKDLERCYDVNLKVNDPAINKERLTTHFKDKTLKEALDVIELIFNLNAEKTSENQIVLRTNSPPENE